MQQESFIDFSPSRRKLFVCTQLLGEESGTRKKEKAISVGEKSETTQRLDVHHRCVFKTNIDYTAK